MAGAGAGTTAGSAARGAAGAWGAAGSSAAHARAATTAKHANISAITLFLITVDDIFFLLLVFCCMDTSCASSWMGLLLNLGLMSVVRL